MTSKFRVGALLAALVAVLAIAPAAFAKGGGDGGGGGSCAQILNFTNTPTYNETGGAAVTTAYTINQGCVDERAASVSLIFHNDDTGFTGTEVTMTPLGTWSVSRTWNATYSTRYTLTLNVYAPNGKLVATQKQTFTTLAAPDLAAV